MKKSVGMCGCLAGVAGVLEVDVARDVGNRRSAKRRDYSVPNLQVLSAGILQVPGTARHSVLH